MKEKGTCKGTSFKTSLDEKAELKSRAVQCGTSMSEYIRGILFRDDAAYEFGDLQKILFKICELEILIRSRKKEDTAKTAELIEVCRDLIHARRVGATEGGAI
jgi:hypothetical protein